MSLRRCEGRLQHSYEYHGCPQVHLLSGGARRGEKAGLRHGLPHGLSGLPGPGERTSDGRREDRAEEDRRDGSPGHVGRGIPGKCLRRSTKTPRGTDKRHYTTGLPQAFARSLSPAGILRLLREPAESPAYHGEALCRLERPHRAGVGSDVRLCLPRHQRLAGSAPVGRGSLRRESTAESDHPGCDKVLSPPGL